MNADPDGSDVASLLYVSKSRLCPPNDINEIIELVATSRRRHAALGVTGALILTQRHFAQFLEGRASAIDELMLSIARDVRHEQMRVVDVTTDRRRRLPSWSLAYWGSATFVDNLIAPLLLAPLRPEDLAVARLHHAILQFALKSEGGLPIGHWPSTLH